MVLIVSITNMFSRGERLPYDTINGDSDIAEATHHISKVSRKKDIPLCIMIGGWRLLSVDGKRRPPVEGR